MKYCIDAYAWIEYLNGGEKGEKVNSFLTKENEIYILAITIAETVSKVKRRKQNAEIAYDAMIKNAQIIGITPRMAKEAGLLHAERRKEIPNFGLADALLLVLARKIKAHIITGDHHFKNFKEAIMI